MAGVGRGEEDDASCEGRREEEAEGIGSCSIELASELASDDEGVASPLSPPFVARTLLVEYRSLDETVGRATSMPAATGGVVALPFAT